MARGQPHYVGVRLTKAEYEGLHRLVALAGLNQSQVIRYLIQVASAHPNAVAAGIRRAQVTSHEQT